jgi:KAP family P-loop domain
VTTELEAAQQSRETDRMSEQDPQIGIDQPLRLGTALKLDKLSRKTFAESAVASLRKVSSSTGLVLSVEGAWGSGKTSALAMMEELLLEAQDAKRPVVVHFNPWLVGEREALLRQFLAKIASTVKLSDHAKDGKKVAKELTAYAKAFDVVKLIPGAEPWASIVKSVVESVGNATGSIAEYKTPDIEKLKQSVEGALQKYPRPIIVFIDDIDRLFPLEVFEMVRIIKAVGDLPHVGYVVAWDPAYVSGALKSADVPQSDSYLEKIVQVRMPLPSLSLSAKGRLINEALDALNPEARKSHFRNDSDRLSRLYFSGLRELLEQPRDITRVFNTVSVIEPALRGEVVLSDIVGLAVLMVKAPTVFDVLRRNPRWFVGRLPGESNLFSKTEDILKEGAETRELAVNSCAMPAATRRVVHFLFPQVAKADDEFIINRVLDTEGHLAHPNRLMVALQLSVSPSDVSMVHARKYLSHPERREEIVRSLTPENCLEFMEKLGDLAGSLEGQGISDLEGLCMSIARLADTEPYPTRSEHRDGAFAHRSEDVARRAITGIGERIAHIVIEDEQSLCLAADLVAGSFLADKDDRESPLTASRTNQAGLLQTFAKNVLGAAKMNRLLSTSNPGFVLWILARSIPDECGKVFAAMKDVDPTLDGFALQFLRHSFDSSNGQAYALPKEIDRLMAYCPLDEFRKHAQLRLSDPSLIYPARAAWRSVVEAKTLYGRDGSESSR